MTNLTTSVSRAVDYRLQVNLNDETAGALRDLTSRSGTSVTETIRRGIVLHSFVDTEVRRGRVALTADPDGKNALSIELM